MFEIGIFTELKGWQSWIVSGCEAAYEAYKKACELCEMLGANNAAIWDPVTKEVIEHMN